MSGSGAPDLAAEAGAVAAAAGHLRVGIAATRWNGEVVEPMLASALATLARLGVRAPTVVRVPGAFELPIAAQVLASNADAVVCLGAVIRGGTPHFDYVCQAVTAGCTRVALDSGVPVGFGVLTCDDLDQARERAGLQGSTEDKGREAAEAAVATAVALRALPHGVRGPGVIPL